MDSKVIDKKIEIVNALMDNYSTITIYFSMTILEEYLKKIEIYRGDKRIDYSVKTVIENRVVINTEHLDIKKLYKVHFDTTSVEVIPHKVLDQKEFIYPKDDLGVNYTKKGSFFKVFAPTATSVKLNIYESIDSSKKESYDLAEGEFGVWEVQVKGDLKGKCYSYNVSGCLSMFDQSREC